MKEFNKKIQEKFNQLCKLNKLFRVNISGEEIWNLYLSSFDNDPKFRDPNSSQHNCNLCKNFIRRYGNIVSIKDNKIVTMFDIEDDTYKVIEDKAVDLVFQNKHLGSGEDFMHELENNILEPAIYDVAKDICRSVPTDDLTASGANLKFENQVRTIVDKKFEEKGLQLITFTFQLVPSEKVRNKIDARSEVNTNVSVIDQQIIEQRKRNELAALKAEENIILSKGITPQLLHQQFIKKWDGKSSLYGTNSLTFLKNID